MVVGDHLLCELFMVARTTLSPLLHFRATCQPRLGRLCESAFTPDSLAEFEEDEGYKQDQHASHGAGKGTTDGTVPSQGR